MNSILNTNIQPLGKWNHSKPNNESFILNTNDGKIGLKKYKIELEKILQNVEGKSIATLKALLDQYENIVLKVQDKEDAKKEYEIYKTLKKNDLKGFVKFEGYFEVNLSKKIAERKKDNNISNLKLQNTNNFNNITEQKQQGVILMKYQKHGSLIDYLKKINFEKNKSTIIGIIIDIITNYIEAYNNIKFTHGDFYLKNIVITQKLNPLIIDFEKSTINKDKMFFYHDIEGFLMDLMDYIPSLENQLINIYQQVRIFSISKEPIEMKEELITLIKTVHN